MKAIHFEISKGLNSTALNNGYDGRALRMAYDSETITTKNDMAMLARFMHGAELKTDYIRLQELANEFLKIGV
jgi:hypothetical protein